MNIFHKQIRQEEKEASPSVWEARGDRMPPVLCQREMAGWPWLARESVPSACRRETALYLSSEPVWAPPTRVLMRVSSSGGWGELWPRWVGGWSASKRVDSGHASTSSGAEGSCLGRGLGCLCVISRPWCKMRPEQGVSERWKQLPHGQRVSKQRWAYLWGYQLISCGVAGHLARRCGPCQWHMVTPGCY